MIQTVIVMSKHRRAQRSKRQRDMLQPKKYSSKKASQRNKRRQIQHHCPTPDKVPHSTRFDAEEAVMNQWRRIRTGKILPLRVYRCECGMWHTTSISQEKQDRIASTQQPFTPVKSLRPVPQPYNNDTTGQTDPQTPLESRTPPESDRKPSDHPLIKAYRQHHKE